MVEDGSLWSTAREFKKHAPPLPAFKGSAKFAYSDADKVRYSSTNRRAPLTVWNLEALAPGTDDGTPPGTEVTSLTQQPVKELLLANAGKEQRSQYLSLTQHYTNSCYPISQAFRSAEALIGRESCK
ncbi:hypothetical protein TNCV_4048821 [Trichonephila clavipes]|nr:hypothetical protein TNCV_4048821 [Trichonephila clavipes]